MDRRAAESRPERVGGSDGARALARGPLVQSCPSVRVQWEKTRHHCEERVIVGAPRDGRKEEGSARRRDWSWVDERGSLPSASLPGTGRAARHAALLQGALRGCRACRAVEVGLQSAGTVV